mmetsp:Transcript_27050/g.40449  ORF Transcript_27050/g.40449 Transcript_27050/m.40449 type:complete len:100 (-) Transcript_27050:210-509(-)
MGKIDRPKEREEEEEEKKVFVTRETGIERNVIFKCDVYICATAYILGATGKLSRKKNIIFFVCVQPNFNLSPITISFDLDSRINGLLYEHRKCVRLIFR